MPVQLSFWIIGETTLAIRCAEALLERGHSVRGVVTAQRLAASWAEKRGIEVVKFPDALPALRATPYDYLLSIVNSRILGPDILATPSRGAINYHDGPLPRYAGMHSTSWAILNGETSHGVTWHGIVDVVDAGPIHKQRLVPIEPDDTALSLNARSYEAALDAFLELADDIGEGRLESREQDLSRRTYYPHLARPDAAGLVDWALPAASVGALVRALDFGPAYPNPLGRAKVRCGARIYLCDRLRPTDRRTSAPAGTVTALDRSGISVAAGDREVVIESLSSIEGEALALTDVIERERLTLGQPLGRLSDETRARITSRNAKLAGHEGYWLRALRRARPFGLPYRKPTASPTGAYHHVPVAVPAPGGVTGTGEAGVATVIAGLSALLARLALEETIHLLVEHPAIRPGSEELGQLFASRVPISLVAPREVSLAGHVAVTAARLDEMTARETFPRDLPARHPELPAYSGVLPVVVRIAPVGGGDADVGAELALDITADGRQASLRVDTGLFAAADAARLGEQLEALLGAMVTHPSLPLGRAPIIPESERHRLIHEWNATDAAYPRDATVHALFEERARSAPDDPAVVAGNTRLTFQELNARADAWAEVLRAYGVGRDAIVGLRIGRSPELVAGMLAVLKAGGAYLPLDLSLPAARTAFMLDDAAVKVVLTTSSLGAELDLGGRIVLLLDRPPPPVVAPVTTHEPADPESLAYVIYTSGSTGTPKGVLVHHRGVVNYLWWAIRYYGATGGSGSPVHSPVAFDLTVTSLIAPLLGGRPVHLLDERLGVDALAGALRDGADFTLVKLTPSHLDLLRHQLAPDDAAGRTRAFVIGGENLQGPALAFWQRHAPRTRLINEYGPTETVVGCCIYDVPQGLAIPGSVPIGRPIANTRLYVLDPAMELLPIGIAGELYIGGDGVARGYLNRPELSAERFVPDPFAGGAARLYRTGDQVRYLADGNLEFLGRLDGQVKVRGYRIELGEIESALAGHPAIAESAATVWHDPVAGPRLVAYVTLRDGQMPGSDELREWCGRFLPEYMVPASVERLPGLPLTSNGKVDRTALPAPAVRTRELVEPRTELERQLCDIWSDVLGVPVGVTDNFFELGGHSLLAVQMIARVRAATGHAPPLPVLLTRPTVEHVAAALEGGPGAAPEDDPLMLRVADGDLPSPFFFMHGDFGGSGFYVQTIARHLPPGQAMYSLRPHRPGGPVTIEEMAVANLSLIRSVQPQGPYLLGGNCNGGAVAYEAARLLREAGEEVRLLALVNTAHRNAHLEPVRRIADTVGRMRRHDRETRRAFYLRLRESVLRTLESRPYWSTNHDGVRRALWWAGTAAATTWRVTRRLAAARLARLLGRAAPPDEPPPKPIRDDLGITISDSDDERRARYRYIDSAMREYLARSSDLDVTLLWWGQVGSFEADPMLHGEDLSRGWGSICRSVDVAILEDGPDLTPDQRLEILAHAIADHVRLARSRMSLAGAATVSR